jgi:hypothetical protein
MSNDFSVGQRGGGTLNDETFYGRALFSGEEWFIFLPSASGAIEDCEKRFNQAPPLYLK